MNNKLNYPVSEKCCKGCTFCSLVHAQCSPGYKYHKCTASEGTKLACKELFDEPNHTLVDLGIEWDEEGVWDFGISPTPHTMGEIDIDLHLERDWDMDEDDDLDLLALDWD